MSVSEKSSSLWDGHYGEVDNNKQRPRLYKDAHALNEAMSDGNSLGLLSEAGQGRMSSGTRTRKGEFDNEAVTLMSEVCIRPSETTPATYVAIGIKREDDDTVDMSYFSITEQGIAVNLNDEMTALSDDDPMMDVLQDSIKSSTKELEKQINKKRLDLDRMASDKKEKNARAEYYKREDRRKLFKGLAKTAISGVGAGALAFGIYSWVQAGIIAPAKAEQEHRVEYDAQNHTLPGDGVVISKEPMTTMSVDAFKDVPKYGGDDSNLDNPRRVTLDSKACLDLKVDGSVQGKKLVAAVSQISPYQVDHITASSVSDKVRVCLVEPVSLSSSDPSIEVAIQLK